MNRITKRIRAAAVAVLMTLGLTAATLTAGAAPASASATWCAYSSSVTVLGISVPTGNYCFSVIGSGTRVDRTTGSWNGAIIVNATERVTFHDRYGNEYASWTTYNKPGNSYGYRYWQSGITGHAKAGGSVCGSFRSAGIELKKICHRIA